MSRESSVAKRGQINRTIGFATVSCRLRGATWRLLLLVVAFSQTLLCDVTGSEAQEAQTEDISTHTATLPVTNVVVFTNGFGLFSCEGRPDCVNGEILLDGCPQACLGTLWFYSPDEGVRVVSVSARVSEVKQMVPCRSLEEILAANIDADITVNFGHATCKGKLREVRGLEPPTHPTGFQGTEFATHGRVVPHTATASQQPIVLIVETADGFTVIERRLINTVTFAQAPATTRELVIPRKQLRITVDGKKDGKVGLCMKYVQQGIRWIPEYVLNLLDENEAEFILAATVINDTTDITNATLQLALTPGTLGTGENLSPLALEATVRGLSSYFVSRKRISSFDEYYAYQAAYTGRPVPPPSALPSTSPDSRLSGVNLLDPKTLRLLEQCTTVKNGTPVLFSKDNVSLARGERLYLPLATMRVRYSFDVVWSVVDPNLASRPGYIEVHRHRGNYGRGMPITPEIAEKLEKLSETDCIMTRAVFTNTSDKPLPPGTVMVVRNWQPLGQGLLKTVMPGETAAIPFAPASGVTWKKNETEIHRREGTRRIHSYYFDEVDLQGELVLTNESDEPQNIKVMRTIIGTLNSATGSPKVSSSPTDPSVGGEQEVTLEWNVKLEPGKSIKLEYSYSTLQGR